MEAQAASSQPTASRTTSASAMVVPGPTCVTLYNKTIPRAIALRIRKEMERGWCLGAGCVATVLHFNVSGALNQSLVGHRTFA